MGYNAVFFHTRNEHRKMGSNPAVVAFVSVFKMSTCLTFISLYILIELFLILEEKHSAKFLESVASLLTLF